MSPTLEDLKKEAVFRQEFVPPNLATLARDLHLALMLEPSAIGTIGDYRHLRGYHRSRAWIRQSQYCTSRSYSVTETVGNMDGGDDNWISGLDIVAGRAKSILIRDRLTFAREQGRLPNVRQIILEDDPWHVHISIDRAHANDTHTTLFMAITGTLPKENPVSTFPITMPSLREGSEGEDVQTAQALMVARGFTVKIDGEFGPKTKAMVKQMQAHYRAEAIDGVFGPETWTIALMRRDAR